jgi:hypothetical protein
VYDAGRLVPQTKPQSRQGLVYCFRSMPPRGRWFACRSRQASSQKPGLTERLDGDAPIATDILKSIPRFHIVIVSSDVAGEESFVMSRYVVTVHRVGTEMCMSRALVELSQLSSHDFASPGERWRTSPR